MHTAGAALTGQLTPRGLSGDEHGERQRDRARERERE